MISLISADGQRDKLLWKNKECVNPYGLGIVIRVHEGKPQRLFPDEFRDYAVTRGAKIVCSTYLEKIRVAGALGVASMGLPYDVVTSEE